MDESYYAFDIEGRPLALVVSEDDRVGVKVVSGEKEPNLVRKYLEANGKYLEILDSVMHPLQAKQVSF